MRKVCSQHPGERAVELGVHVGDVLEGDGLVEQHLVEGQREAAVEVVPVEHGQPDDAPDKVEVGQVLLCKFKRGEMKSE